MFRPMRNKKQELTQEECVEILKNEPRGVLAILGDNDYPYSLPLTYVYADGKIYFHGANSGHKLDAIKKNSKASFCVMDKGIKQEDDWWYTFKSVIVFGNIKILTDMDEKIDKLTCLGDKFFPTHDMTVKEIKRLSHKTEVFEFTIDHMRGKFVREK